MIPTNQTRRNPTQENRQVTAKARTALLNERYFMYLEMAAMALLAVSLWLAI